MNFWNGSNHLSDKISIYIHWPFCLSKCLYCGFNSIPSSFCKTFDEVIWVDALCSEIKFECQKNQNKEVNTIFFGGGTPSLISSSGIEKILNSISWRITDNCEITIEANPDTITKEKLLNFASVGVNRISMGVQSFDDSLLKILGRRHSSEDAIKKIELIDGIFNNFSFDLMYGIPGQSLKNWEEEIKKAVSYAGYHISAYQLTIEDNTPLANSVKSGKLLMPNEDFFNVTSEMLPSFGFNQYEISNFSKKGYESRHNLAYWKYKNYLGIGPGAHSRVIDSNGNKIAVERIESLDEWLCQVNEVGHGIKDCYILSETEAFQELLIMGLRLSEGVELDDNSSFTVSLKKSQEFKKLLNESIIEECGNFIKINKQHRCVTDYIISKLT